MAFNGGCVDGDEADWDPTLRLIVNSDIPALFTTYDALEARNERSKMKDLGAKFIVEPAENKWRNLVLVPEFMDAQYEVWYQNNYR